ncbi:MAG: type II CRISPR RNA-guided endonuclease Cas9, partial [Culicoidibacterales bacterium]
NLFIDKNFNDKHYFAQYPTMYHLRHELMYGRGTSEAMDPRLIYLALNHLLKYRGNFLYEEQDLSGITNAFDEEFFSFAELLNESQWLKNDVSLDQIQAIMAILKNTQLYRSEQVKQAVAVLGQIDASAKKQWEQIFKAIVGLTANTKLLFNESFVNEAGKPINLDLGSTTYEETKDTLAMLLQEDIEIINGLEKMYSWYVLQGVLQGEAGLTQAMLAKYEKHMADLKVLKTVIREYCDQAVYNRMFRDNDDKLANYVNYIKKTMVKSEKTKPSKICSQEDLYKEIKKMLKDCDHDERVQQIFEDIDKQAFLPKQNSKENGAIPYQLQLQELELILANQSQFHPELAAVKEKIEKILTFRIPYYVGPLTETEKSDFAWVQFKGQGRIYPWNFEELVDRDASAEKFIERMRSTCTYLLGEPVFPRYSLLYNEYTVLNELNKVRINGKLLSVSQKQDIFEKCFKKLGKKTVTRKDIENHCKTNWQPFNQNYAVTGTQDEKGFAANLGSYVDFVKIFGEQYVKDNPAVIEQLIEWLTVFEDKKIIKRKIMAVYPELEESVAKITRLRYSGWSNLSHKLLAELTTTIEGQKQTIMDVLWETNKNFMQIINDETYDFKAQIDGQLTDGESKKITYEEVYKLAGSPALKRGIWQTIQVVEEIQKVVGYPPTNIFIEFAREDQASKRTTSRLRQLENLYDNMDQNSDLVNLRTQLNGKDNQEITNRMFLYFTQNGKCAYSAEPLSLEMLHT